MMYDREGLFSEAITVFAIQIALAVAIFVNVSLERQDEPPSFSLAYTRFAAGILLQLSLTRELQEGMLKMKYCLNHPYKFSFQMPAFFAGFFQATALILVTLLNYYLILEAASELDVVMNFLALEVVANIDDMFYASHGSYEHSVKMVVNENGSYDQLYQLETTTSDDAAEPI